MSQRPQTSEDRRPSPVARAMILAVQAYRYTLSAFVGRTCRYLPTCSEFAIEALRRHGAWRGGWLAFFRLSRCRPGGGSGHDPVPERVPDFGWRFWRYRRPGADSPGEG